MAESIVVFANSLRDYLIEVQVDSYNKQNQVNYKYNNLKVYMDPKKLSIPHFFVSLGISLACYSIEDCSKISGSVGAEERFVTRWASRTNIQGELKKHWTYITKSNVLMTSKVKNESKVQESLDIAKEELKDASESVTGTGVKRKFVAFESNMRRRRNTQSIERVSGRVKGFNN